MRVWHEIVIEGPEKVARGFVAGFTAALSEPDGVVLGEDIALDEESLGERLRNLLGAGARLTVLAPESVAARMAEAFARDGGAVGLRVERRRQITSVSFSFTAEAFALDQADAIRTALMGSLPEGVVLEDRHDQEQRSPEAGGVELYAPKHNYVYRARGRFSGPLPGVLEMHRRASDLAFVQPTRLELHGVVLEEHTPAT